MTNPSNHRKLRVILDDNNKLTLLTADAEKMRFTDLQSISDGSPDLQTVTLEVNDFYANGTSYRVFGLVLDSDDSTITRYWQPTASGAGVQAEFRFMHGEPGETFVVGARPADSGKPPVLPHTSKELPGGGGLPGTGDPGSGSGSGGGTSGG